MKQLRWSTLKVGVVVTLAIVILFFTVMFAGNIEDLLVPKIEIHAIFDDVRGLRDGSPVWFSGVEIGSVESIHFTHHEKVKVAMLISSDTLQYLRKDSSASIFTLGLLGDKYIEINPGSESAPGLMAGDSISGVAHIEIQDVVETGQESIASLTEFIDMLEEVLVKIERGEGTVAKFIKDPSIYDNLKETTAELSRLVKKIESGRGTLGRLIDDETLYQNASSSADNIRIFTDDLRTSEGTLNRLIEDKSLYENLNAASEKLDSLLEQINESEGLVARLVRDKEMAEDLKTTLKEINALVKDIKEQPEKYFKFSIF
ncbi:MAG: MCE family protein [Nitrospiraceae bacterium]|nr:MAG: MCE family protein [Nitrospiraceae bacterium]